MEILLNRVNGVEFIMETLQTAPATETEPTIQITHDTPLTAYDTIMDNTEDTLVKGIVKSTNIFYCGPLLDVPNSICDLMFLPVYEKRHFAYLCESTGNRYNSQERIEGIKGSYGDKSHILCRSNYDSLLYIKYKTGHNFCMIYRRKAK